jgi:hypothetical protein
MRRLIVLAVLGALALAGCGDDGAKSPLDEALGHLPKDAPIAIAVSTDIDGDQYKAVDSIIGRFPFGGQIKGRLKSEVEKTGVDFEDDVKPLLGNDFVIGAPTANAADEERFVGAGRVRDEGKLQDLVEDDEDLKRVGRSHGATLYEDEGDTFVAVKDDVVVLSDARKDVEEALERRDGDDRLREDDFDKALSGLPDDALVRVYGDARPFLRADPEAAEARKVKWVGALRTFGIAASAARDSVTFDFRLNTDPAGLTAEDLPFAGGGPVPPVLRTDAKAPEVAAGIRDPAQIVEFAQRAGQAVDPAAYAVYERNKERINRRLDTDIDRDLIGQFGGNLALTGDPSGDFGARADLQNPRQFQRTLRKITRLLPSFAEGAGLGRVSVEPPGRGEDFYTLAAEGGQTAVFGVVGDVFVAANDARRASTLASDSPAPLPGATGSVVAVANAEQLAEAVIAREGGLEAIGASLFTGPLGDLTTSLGIDTSGLRGQTRLKLD